MLYLYEKRWKETARLLTYGVLFFFAPFAMFGGVEGLQQFVRNQAAVQTMSYRGVGSIRILWTQFVEGILKMTTGKMGVIVVVLYVLLAVLGSFFVRG